MHPEWDLIGEGRDDTTFTPKAPRDGRLVVDRPGFGYLGLQQEPDSTGGERAHRNDCTPWFPRWFADRSDYAHSFAGECGRNATTSAIHNQGPIHLFSH